MDNSGLVNKVKSETVSSLEHVNPAEAEESEIVGKPTMLAKYSGVQDVEQVLAALGRISYPLEDVSVLLQFEGSDQVIDQATGDVAGGQSITAEELAHNKVPNKKGHTVVLLHPLPAQVQAVQAALGEVGPVEVEYSGETHAHGHPGEVLREDEKVD